jgi:BirA family biotin operon repressor/biotin-[acetyl-CoA-carboxylase] ligase
LADAAFVLPRFIAALRSRRLGLATIALDRVGSTNDEVWRLLADGAPDGVTVVADAQSRGRGRAGRTWAHAPGLGLALSVGLRLPGPAAHAGALPLAAGLAVAESLAARGVATRLKWPNDVLVDGRKLAGVLCELRRLPDGRDSVVVGVGVNVRQRAEDFPPELRASAISLAQAGCDAAVEDVAAEFLAALERRADQLLGGDRAGVLAAWSGRAAFWGEPVSVQGPLGAVTGVAQRLDDDGALVLRLENGAEWTAVAGDLDPGVPARGEAR